jgi:hypothetical protein
VNICQAIFFIVFALSLCCCEGPPRQFSAKSALAENEVRGRVLAVDTNTSMVKVEILACGKNLEKEWGGVSGFEQFFAVQPGDLNLLNFKINFSSLNS